MVNVLFVCMGNICRSPTAHGIFLSLIKQHGLEHAIAVDSAGTHDYHVGAPPDRRAQASALKRGIDISGLRARHVDQIDFERFDYVLAMDRDNYRLLRALCPEHHEYKLKLFMEFAPHLNQPEVPDPYYGGASGFERVLDMVEEAARGLLEDIRHRHLSSATAPSLKS
ncbi:MAG TPA: low molecular weight protein-tyrosine-phosphatase [Gammaproteobacteria bacterium]|nr:low molecular weight protein-tyrosine-phosphatase [Gammaproteobacteria bacterium]